MNEPSAADRLVHATAWTRSEFEALDRELDAMGCAATHLKRAGIAYRLGERVVVRVFPRDGYLTLGFPNRLREDVEVLSGALRPQRGESFLNYGPDVCDRDAVLTLLARSASGAATTSVGPAIGAGAHVVDDELDARASTVVRDDHDLQLILDLLTAFSRYAAARGAAPPIKALREAIWFHWESPRLPVGGKYSPHFPHSPGARNRKEAGSSVGLISEHLLPVRILIGELLADMPRDTGELRARLVQDLDHVVITVEEDKLLTAAGVASKVPSRTDPWSRYRAAGLDPDGFTPLA